MKSNSGNVLFIILLAVALFAALSYAVTSSTRNGGANANNESIQVSAARILNFGSAVQTGIMRLVTVNGISITSIKYNSDVYTTKNGASLYGMLGSPANPSLYLFHPSGGAVIPQTFTDLSVPCSACSGGGLSPGHSSFVWINIPETGSAVADAALLIGSLSQSICAELNRSLDITGVPILNLVKADLPSSTGIASVAASSGSTTQDLDAVKGKSAFCYQEVASPYRYQYIQILQVN
jgi:hypothetical protein